MSFESYTKTKFIDCPYRQLVTRLGCWFDILQATKREPVRDAEVIARDYRLNPQDAVLERAVLITRVIVWVPVMPTTVLPTECFGEAGVDVTWRRYAFERAHVTFLEPHRPSSATFQALKRMAFWPTMFKDFTYFRIWHK